MELSFTTTQTFTDITDHIPVTDARLMLVFVPHTTCGLRIMENEIGVLQDTERFLERMVPKGDWYAHHLMELRDVPDDEPHNGHSHVRFLFFNTSELIPIEEGRLGLGRWQRLFLVDLDYGRTRTVTCQSMW